MAPLDGKHLRTTTKRGGNLLKTYIYPADLFGCGHYRLIWIAQQLKKEGHDIEIVLPGQSNLRGQLDKNGDTISVSAPKDADIIVVQRVTNRHLAQAIPLWRAHGITVILDLDDDLSCIHPANPAFAALHPINGKGNFSWRLAEKAASNCTMVTVSTPALAKRYPSDAGTAVLHNYVPESYVSIKHTDSDVIGWGGAVASHPDDITVIGHALAQLVEEGAHFRIVGPPDGVEQVTCIRDPDAWSASGSVDLKDWPRVLARQIGIGIAPLADTRFNAAKSWLKPLEYAALGIPALMSPRAEYTALHKKGIGLLCKKPRDWERALRELVKNPSLREEMSEEGRAVASEMTIEQNAWRWMEMWEEALHYQQGKKKATVLSN